MTRWLAGGVALVKFRYHVTFLNVVFGALIFAPSLDRSLAWRLVELYLSFNVLLYSGLYTINDIRDRESDARHPLKRRRPIPSGRVPVGVAVAWTTLFLIAGFATGALLGGTLIIRCYLAVTAINVAYSWGGRNVVYLDVLLNGLPHVVRFVMGVLFVGRQPPVTHLVAFLAVTIAISCLRRRIELDVPGWDARQSLRAWSAGRLNLVMAGALFVLSLLAAWKGATAPGFYAILVGAAVVLVGGAHASREIRSRLQWVWTH